MNTIMFERTMINVYKPKPRFVPEIVGMENEDEEMINKALVEVNSEPQVFFDLPLDIFSTRLTRTQTRKGTHKSRRGILKGIDVKNFEEYLKKSREK